jgi:gliding motility-associated-like protein
MKNWLLICFSFGYLMLFAQVPTAQFSANSFVVCVGETVQFTDLSTANGSPINVWTYNFGDGNSSNSQNPTHAYSLAGTYTVNLVVTAANGQADAEVKPSYITVNPLPTSDFTASTNGCSLPVGVTFTNTSIGGISYEWDFGNGQTSTQQNPATVNYTTAGTYAVTLISTNSFGCVDTTIQNIVISSFQAGIDAPISTCAGSPLTISDLSTVGADQWSWSFPGANSTSSGSQNNMISYASPGTYTISLTAQNTVAGCMDNTSVSIDVLPIPVPNLTADLTSGCAPLNVSFSSTGDSGSTYSWDFGDGQTSPLENPSHTYTTDGSFTVTLSVTDANGCTGVFSMPNYINTQAPTGTITADTMSGCAPLTVQLASNVTSPLDPIVSWVWDFGDGTTYTGEFPPSHVYAVGSFDVTLTVTTAGGCSSTVTAPALIQTGQIDLVDFTWDIPLACVNVPIQFTDQSVISVPHDPSEVNYFWEFGDGGTSTLPDPQYSYSSDTGYFDVQLVIDFRGCRDTMIYTNVVYILAPVSIFQPSQTLFCNPTSFPITVNFTDNSIIGILSDDADMTWDWGDGTQTFYDDPDFDDPDQGSTSHDYSTYGAYTIEQLIHNYTTGCVDSSTATVNISQTIASITTDVDSVCLGYPVTFTSTSTSTDAFGTFLWEAGDGGVLSGNSVPYVYGASGNYTVSLTAANALGCADSTDLSFVTALDPPMAGINASDLAGCAPLNVTFSNASVTQGNGVPLESFLFQFNDDGTTVTTNDLTSTVSHTFNFVGTYSTFLTATDEFGCVSAPAFINVSITVPTADFNVDHVICNGESVNAINTSSGVAPMTYQWFLDGAPIATTPDYSTTFNEPYNPSQSQVVHQLMLVTMDANGCTDTTTQNIHVSTPHADLSYVLDGAETNAAGEFVCPPVFVDFTDESISFGTITSYVWTFGDGNASTLQSPSNTYIFPGTYSANMSITNEYGCSSDTALIDFLTIYGPSADPSWTESLNACGLTVNLDVGPTQNVTGILWNLDDGTSVTGGNTLVHLYDQIGTYNPTVTVNDDNNCQVVFPLGPFVLNQPLLTVVAQGDAILCYGAADGNVTGTVTGGMAPYTVTLVQTGGTQSVLFDGGTFDFSGLSGAPSGGSSTYTVSVVDAGGAACMVISDPVTLTEPPAPVNVSLDAQQDILCFGNATGTISVSANGGTAPYTYSWTGPNGFSSNTDDLTGLVAGTYILTVTDANGIAGGCTDGLSVTLSQPVTGVSIALDAQTNESCFGQSIGAISVTASGGVPPYDYNWTGPNGFVSSSEDLNSLPAGTYNLAVSDASGGGCNALLSVTLTEPPLLTVSTQTTTNYNGFGISCYSFSDGGISASPIGGTPGYSYSWTSDPATSTSILPSGQNVVQSPVGLTVGNYLLTVTDANGCTVSDQVALTEPTPLLLDTIVLSLYSNGFNLSGCSPDGTAEATVSGGVPGYVFDWSNDGTGDLNDPNPVTQLSAGLISLTVQDLNGCIISGSATLVAEDNVLALSSTQSIYPSGDHISCFGLNDGFVDLTATGGTLPYAYAWTADPSTPSAIVPGGQASGQDLNSITAGTYQVTVTEATGCTATLTVTLTEPSALTQAGSSSMYPSGDNIQCNGDANGAILNYTIAGGSPNYVYNWTADPSTPAASIPAGQESVASPTGLTAGIYNITVTDINGCQIDTTITLVEPSVLTQSGSSSLFPSGDNIQCNGDANGAVLNYTIAGGSPNYVYNWTTDPSTPTASIPAGQESVASPAGLTAGTYNVTVTDINGCQIDTTITLIEPSVLTQAGSSSLYPSEDNIQCNGDANGSVFNYTIVGGSPSYVYNWTTDPSTPTASIPVGQESVPSPTGLTAGTYHVTVTDINGCSIDTTITLIEPAALNISAVVPDYGGYNVAGCLDNGSIDLTIIGGSPGYDISWSNGEISEDIDSLAAGLFSVTITDINGCQITLDTTLIESDPLVVTAFVSSDYNGQDISCYQAADGIVEVLVTGGAPNFTYSWTDSLGIELGTQPILNDLGPGDYQVVVADQYNCLDTSIITVTEPTPLVIDIASITNYNGFDISCYSFSDGAIDFTLNGGTPGYTYSWTDSTGAIISDLEDPSGLPAGTYTVLAADINGCSIDTVISLSQPTPLDGNVFITSDYNGQNVSCFQSSDGSISANVSGGVPDYVFTWYDGTGNVISSGTEQTNIPAGQYTWVATDLNGCTFSQTVILSEPAPVTVDPQILSFYFGAAVSCAYNSDGVVSATAAGGVPGYTYAWNTSPIQNSAIASGLAAGTYTVTATDLNGCVGTNTVTLTANPSPQPVLPPPVQGCIGTSILVEPVPGTWNYCSWTFSDGQQFNDCGPFSVSFDTSGCIAAQLTVISPEGCVGSAISSNFACIQPNPIASFYAENYQVTNVVPGTNLINTSVGASSYYWYYSDVSYYDTTLNVYHEFIPEDPNQVNTFEVILYAVSEFGCIDSTSRNITMIPVVLVYVPNAFTPDGDGFNNSFFPVISGAYSDQGYEFLIFNRWGELIFESSTVGEGWDGTYRDHKCQDGVYTWKLKVGHTYDYEIEEFVGHVSLLRGGGN